MSIFLWNASNSWGFSTAAVVVMIKDCQMNHLGPTKTSRFTKILMSKLIMEAKLSGWPLYEVCLCIHVCENLVYYQLLQLCRRKSWPKIVPWLALLSDSLSSCIRINGSAHPVLFLQEKIKEFKLASYTTDLPRFTRPLQTPDNKVEIWGILALFEASHLLSVTFSLSLIRSVCVH